MAYQRAKLSPVFRALMRPLETFRQFIEEAFSETRLSVLLCTTKAILVYLNQGFTSS